MRDATKFKVALFEWKRNFLWYFCQIEITEMSVKLYNYTGVQSL